MNTNTALRRSRQYIIEWREIPQQPRGGDEWWNYNPPPDLIMVVNGCEVAQVHMNWGGWWEVWSFVHRMNWWPDGGGWKSDHELRYAMDLVVDEFAGDLPLRRGWRW